MHLIKILLSNDCSLSSAGWAVNYLLNSGTEEEFDSYQLCLRVHIFCQLVRESLFLWVFIEVFAVFNDSINAYTLFFIIIYIRRIPRLKFAKF